MPILRAEVSQDANVGHLYRGKAASGNGDHLCTALPDKAKEEASQEMFRILKMIKRRGNVMRVLRKRLSRHYKTVPSV